MDFNDFSPKKLPFHNRQKEIDLFKNHIDIYKEEDSFFQTISFIGNGGYGKTRLIERFKEIFIVESDKFKIIHVNLEIEKANNILAPLQKIRQDLKYDCILFDIAINFYKRITALPIDLYDANTTYDSTVYDLIQKSIGYVYGTIPSIKTLMNIWNAIKKDYIKDAYYSQKDITNLDRFLNNNINEPSIILNVLPFCLALDIKIKQKNGLKHIFFYDAYEKQSYDTLNQKNTWLNSFILSMESSFHIIISRIRPNLDYKKISYSEYLLETFSIDHSKEFIKKNLDFTTEEILSQIIKVSHSIPFYMEAIILDLKTKTNYSLDDISKNDQEVIERFLNHLTVKNKEIISVLASVQYFNERLLSDIFKSLHITQVGLDFQLFSQYFFIESVIDHKVYKTHDLLTRYQLENNKILNQDNLYNLILNSLASIEIQTIMNEDFNTLKLLYSGILNFSASIELNTKIIEKIIDVGYYFYDYGFWNDILHIFKNLETTNIDISNIATFFTAISLRRVKTINEAKYYISSLEKNNLKFGKHVDSLILEEAYIDEINGNYNQVRNTFKSLFIKYEKQFDPTNRIHLKTFLFHTDFLMMDGYFQDSFHILIESKELIEDSSRSDWLELQREMAHIYRFNFLFHKAFYAYWQALEYLPENNNAMKGKLLTNLSETLCWFDHKLPIKYGKDALSFNEKINSNIEIAKNYISLSISYIGINDLYQAEEHFKLGHTLFEKANYKAGVLFSYISKLLILKKLNDNLEMNIVLKKIEILIDELGTYDFLLVTIYYILNDTSKFEMHVKKFKWINQNIDKDIKNTIDTILLQ